jgi:hypothetical protein
MLLTAITTPLNMIKHLNWRTLVNRRTDARLVYKITHELVVIPKTDILIPPVRFSWNKHSLSYQIPPTRIQLRQRKIRKWNSLPLNTVKSDSVESFKSAVSVINH